MDVFHEHGRNDLRIRTFRELRTQAAELDPGFEGWLGIEFPDPLEIGEKDAGSDDDRVIVALEANSNVWWAAVRHPAEIAQMAELRAQQERWSAFPAMGAMRLDPAPRLGEAANVIDGFHRRFSRGPTHLWMSAPSQALPQEVSLTWPEPVSFGEVTVTFDNLERSAHDNPWEGARRASEFLVREYALLASRDGNPRELAHVTENHHRVRRHAIGPVVADALVLRVIACHAPGHTARVYSIAVRGAGVRES
jgi:hypothetical protein